MTPQGFDRVGFDQAQLHKALRAMCPKALRGYSALMTTSMRNMWTPENPTRFCCYFVSEMVFWYCAPEGSRPMAVGVAGEETPHRFVERVDGSLIDLTCDQFPEGIVVDYRAAMYRPFLQTGGPGPSKRAQELARQLGMHTIIPKQMTRERWVSTYKLWL